MDNPAVAMNVICAQVTCNLAQVEAWADTVTAFEQDLLEKLGVDVPRSVGQTVGTDELLLLRIAPRRLWLLRNDNTPIDLSIDDGIGCFLSLAEGRVCFRYSGEGLPSLVERHFAIDWDGNGLAPDGVIQTMLHRVPATLVRRGTSMLDILVPRTFAVSLHESLI